MQKWNRRNGFSVPSFHPKNDLKRIKLVPPIVSGMPSWRLNRGKICPAASLPCRNQMSPLRPLEIQQNSLLPREPPEPKAGTARTVSA